MSKILEALEKANQMREETQEKPSQLRKEVVATQSMLRGGMAEGQVEPETGARALPLSSPLPLSAGGKAFPWRYGVGAGVALALGLGLYLRAEPPLQAPQATGRELAPKPAASAPAGPAALAQPRPGAKPPQPARVLPKVVPLQAPDPAYAAAHPGWQRYQGDTLEFRVFREGKAIKAIQVLSRQGNPIPWQFFLGFMAEIANRDPFKVQAVQEKEGYYLEKGKAGEVAEVTLYRKKPSGEIRGFVVAYL